MKAKISALLMSFIWAFSFPVLGQNPAENVRLWRQKSFKQAIPPGNYSGITPLGNDMYAVVNDKSSTDGFHVFSIVLDSISGKLRSARNVGFISNGRHNRDAEGIAFMPDRSSADAVIGIGDEHVEVRSGTLWISGEGDGGIKEYRLDGELTGRSLTLPAVYAGMDRNFGLESLAYSEATGLFWTCSECTLPTDGQPSTSTNGLANRLRLQSFGADLQPSYQYFYLMDAPKARKSSVNYACGVSEMLAMNDGCLLVLEREFFVPKKKIGAFVVNKIYRVCPENGMSVGVNDAFDEGKCLPKQLVAEWKTRLNLTRRSLANYEGMCIGPRLSNGRQVVILISDSQNRYKGILKDWIKTLVL